MVIKTNNLLLARQRIQLASALHLSWQGVLFSLATVATSTALLFGLGLAPYNVNMIYVLLTLFATVWFGLASGVLTAVLAFLCFDYFFIPPYFTFLIDAGQGWIAVFLFLGTALFANQVAGRARLHDRQAQERAQEVAALYDVATAVITRIDRTEMLRVVLQKLCEALALSSGTLFLSSKDEVPGEIPLTEVVRIENSPLPGVLPRHPDPALVQTVIRRNEATFLAGQNLGIEPTPVKESKTPRQESSYGPVAYFPLVSGSQKLGVLVLVARPQADQLEFDGESRRLLAVFSGHVALAVEHAVLIEKTAQLAALRESDQLKSALLASVSHELRTPLTSIKAATDNLQTGDINWSVEERKEFLAVIEQETERLIRVVSNLLDLSKIEAGVLKPDFGWHFLPEIVEEVVERLRNTPLMHSHSITTSFAAAIPLTMIDYVQIDQVLTNLIENAAKYSRPGQPVQVQVEIKTAHQLELEPPDGASLSALAQTRVLVVKVVDEGIGIPPGQLNLIFDKFYRVHNKNEMKLEVAGSGIGLTIAKGIVEAHGGQIWAQNRAYGGTIFSFTLPIVPFSEAV